MLGRCGYTALLAGRLFESRAAAAFGKEELRVVVGEVRAGCPEMGLGSFRKAAFRPRRQCPRSAKSALKTGTIHRRKSRAWNRMGDRPDSTSHGRSHRIVMIKPLMPGPPCFIVDTGFLRNRAILLGSMKELKGGKRPPSDPPTGVRPPCNPHEIVQHSSLIRSRRTE